MIDADVVAVSPSSVYRVLERYDLLCRWNKKKSSKGNGFNGPLRPHEHWHVDISYLNICGTFFYLCCILDGYSRYILAWDIRPQMTENEVAIIIQRAQERYPEQKPRIISDNGPQFIAKEFKSFLRSLEMTHVFTSVNYPQSNGKMERFFETAKINCIRPNTFLTVDEARERVAEYISYYNDERLHGTIGHVAPLDKLNGREQAIFAARERKLARARASRKASSWAARVVSQREAAMVQ